MNGDEARHTATILGDVDVIACDEGAALDSEMLLLAQHKITPKQNELVESPSVETKKMEQGVVALFTKVEETAKIGDTSDMGSSYEAQHDDAKEQPGTVASKNVAKRVEDMVNIMKHTNLSFGSFEPFENLRRFVSLVLLFCNPPAKTMTQKMPT